LVAERAACERAMSDARHAAKIAITRAYRAMRSQTMGGTRILMYHSIGNHGIGDARGIYAISPARFEEQMRYLTHHHRDALSPLSADAGAVERIAVTFDDGYADTLTAAAPVLAQLGIPFTVFVWTGAVAERRAGFLDAARLRELDAMPGATIGSHTVNHLRLATCDAPTIAGELGDSKAWLEDVLSTEVSTLSYPHGSVDRRVRDAAAEAGYRLGATSRFSVNRAGCDPLALCRTEIWGNDDPRSFTEKLRGDWDWLRWIGR
jgi:peptidoglycan/xylan/chitin deacetylase (PgdA/CDA1 family)